MAPQDPQKPKKANLLDHHSIKRVLDEVATEVITANGYSENFTLGNIKMVIGLVICALAAASHFLPKKFPTFDKDCVIISIVAYFILTVMLQYIIFFKEKNHIMFTNPLKGSFTSTGLVVSSKFPGYSDIYSLEIASADPKSKSANPPVELSKSVTQWFTKDGHLVETIFREDVEGLLKEYTRDSRKSK